MKLRSLIGLAAGMLLAPSAAQAQIPDRLNECTQPGGVGDVCINDAECEANAYATICIEGACQIPCGEADALGVETPDYQACATGETCVESAGQRFHCKASKFRVDLNLLDQCIVQFISNTPPPLGSGNVCSLEANLNALLDQNSDHAFNIFDVDLCIRAFLTQPGCDLVAGTCEATDLVPCADDDDCGFGLYCDENRNTCQRDCGLIASREEGFGALERQCSGRVQACDITRGRCETVDIEGLDCEVDSDCPQGAYCFLGECAPECFRSSECPDSQWICTVNNRCRTLPSPAADGEFVFDPLAYSLVFAGGSQTLDAIDNEKRMPLLVMDLRTKKEERFNPSVSFGYRLEIIYGRKQDQKCFKPTTEWTDEERADCLIDPDEEWITPLQPFGTVTAVGNPGVTTRLNAVAADRLTPGLYTATVNAIFDNGNQDSFQVFYVKPTPSGEYTGNLTVYLDSLDNALNGRRPLTLRMELSVAEERDTWNNLLLNNNLIPDEDIVDVTEGFEVHGYMLGDQMLMATNPAAVTTGEQAVADRIPVKGLYSPRLGRMTLISVIDIAADHCVSENGPCSANDPAELQARNPFGRPIRRVIQFTGPFDEARGVFNGIYRETLSGLVAGSELTLEGGFILNQVRAEDSEFRLDAPLISDSLFAVRPSVDFPSVSAVLSAIEAEVIQACVTDGADPDDAAAAHFEDAASYESYLASDSDYPIFPELVEFKALIADGLASLQNSSSEALTIHEYLTGRILTCPDANAEPSPVDGDTPPGCVDEATLRCGQALYLRALRGVDLAGNPFVDIDALRDDPSGEHELFCSRTRPVAGCRPDRIAQPGLATLQEHNRFQQELASALRFSASRDLSDAFFTLYRNAVSPFTRTEAVSFREQKLRSAVDRFDTLVEQTVGVPSSDLLFRWPMESFKSRGNDWLQQMTAVSSDRLDALTELVDLKRRVFLSAERADFVFANHLMQMEYLTQAWLIALQRTWQGPSFAYAGNAAQLFEKGQNLLLRLNEAKNPLGISPNRVFFESQDPRVENWKAFREVLVGEDGDGGMLARARDEVDLAVQELRGALSDVDTLEERIFDSRNRFEDRMVEICGDENTGCAAVMANYSPQEWVNQRDCRFQDPPNDTTGCGASFECPQESAGYPVDDRSSCKAVVQNFSDFTDDVNDAKPICNLEADSVNIQVGGETRNCGGGQMGVLIQERARLEVVRKQVLDDLQSLVKRVGIEQRLFEAIDAKDKSTERDILNRQIVQHTISAVHEFSENVFGAESELFGPLECMIIFGLSGGTNCIGWTLKGGRGFISYLVNGALSAAMVEIVSRMEQAQNNLAREYDRAVDEFEQHAVLRNLNVDLDDLVSAYEMAAQEIFNVTAQIEDLRFQAQHAADRFGDEVSFVADHLIGRESGNILLGQQLVADSSQTFQQLLLFTYKMTTAFVHRFDLPDNESEALYSRVFLLQTLDDVEDYIRFLDDTERDYCGREALDCDAFNNLEVLRFSVRDELFPTLRDIVDARTGQVITKGQQFHNIITSPPFLKRRIRAGEDVDQVEIPFAIWLQVRENGPGGNPRWMINPLDCNHVIEGNADNFPNSAYGTVAMNVLGQNLDDNTRQVRYELWRGATDFMRACHPVSSVGEIGTDAVVSYPIDTHIIGYAPQHVNAALDSPPSFVTRSSRMGACINEPEVAGEISPNGCWRFFARDRSLAAPDWTLTLPLRIGGADTANTWLLGDGLRSEERPIIEDLVLYIRHRTRPVQEF